MGKKMHEVVQELGLHENTIRNLERKGLINPIMSLAGHRIFTEQEIQKIRQIYEKKND